ncbi:helix-turn-helix domain-containing protein [Faecalibaculum rodentium]|uniref:helix-turn-helix domain-containing protein n=1 Tax=Faecalibaculum rodentium TaxID=1702221 RepID=UPI00256EE7FA|nr:helix-turn-helix domain-containing protein [Faecalibaculum rodentium]
MENADYYNPLRTYMISEVAELMHCGKDSVTTWMEAGLLRGIKTGKATVIPSGELARFQEEYLGQNVCNLKRALDALKAVKGRAQA